VTHLPASFGQCIDDCKLNLFLAKKVGVTERLRSSRPRKAVAMVIFPIIVYNITKEKRVHNVLAVVFMSPGSQRFLITGHSPFLFQI